MPGDNSTFPHDYRVLFSGPELPVVAGGQAVNLWAITYLEGEPAQELATKYGSGDMDIVRNDARHRVSQEAARLALRAGIPAELRRHSYWRGAWFGV